MRYIAKLSIAMKVLPIITTFKVKIYRIERKIRLNTVSFRGIGTPDWARLNSDLYGQIRSAHVLEFRLSQNNNITSVNGFFVWRKKLISHLEKHKENLFFAYQHSFTPKSASKLFKMGIFLKTIEVKSRYEIEWESHYCNGSDANLNFRPMTV